MAVNQFIYYLHSAEKKRRGCVGGNGGGSLAALLASSLAGMVEWPGIYWMKMEEEMELMEVWIEEVRWFDNMRASHNDLLSLQKSMVIEGWLALADVQDNADSMAAASSS